MSHPEHRVRSGVIGSNPPLVSIVIPCHNQAQFLTAAIQSAFNQTYSAFEIIVIDDGSTDNTRGIAALYPEILCMHQENRGLSCARNRGLAHSAGEYVIFLDADDCLMPNALQVGVQSLVTRPECAFVYGHLQFIDREGRLLPTPVQRRVTKDHCVELLRGDYIWTPGVVMYRRHVLEAMSGFNPLIDACADCDLNIRITRDYPVYFHGQKVLQYRQHGGNMSRNAALMLKTALAAHRLQLNYVRGDHRYEEAAKIGKRAAQDYFGRHLADQALALAKARDFGHTAKALWVLLCCHPRGFAKYAGIALRGLVPKLKTI